MDEDKKSASPLDGSCELTHLDSQCRLANTSIAEDNQLVQVFSLIGHYFFLKGNVSLLACLACNTQAIVGSINLVCFFLFFPPLHTTLPQPMALYPDHVSLEYLLQNVRLPPLTLAATEPAAAVVAAAYSCYIIQERHDRAIDWSRRCQVMTTSVGYADKLSSTVGNN